MTSAKRRSDLRVAIVGFGSIGHRHFENLRSLGVGEVIVVRRPARANPAFTPSLGTPVAYSPQAALQYGVDLAVICNPTSLHVPTAQTFVAADVPVLIEKPAADRLRPAVELAELADGRGVHVGVAYCMRYHPAYAAARGAVEAGKIGRLLYAKAWFESYLPDWHPWEDYRESYAARKDLGGGVLPTLDHEIDFLNWCLGTPLSADCQTTRTGALEANVDDWAVVSLRYAGGVRGAAHLSLCRRDYARGFELVGKTGTLSYGFDTKKLRLISTSQPAPEILWDGGGHDLNTMYRDMLADFLDSVVAGRPAPVPLESGIQTLRVGTAKTEVNSASSMV